MLYYSRVSMVSRDAYIFRDLPSTYPLSFRPQCMTLALGTEALVTLCPSTHKMITEQGQARLIGYHEPFHKPNIGRAGALRLLPRIHFHRPSIHAKFKRANKGSDRRSFPPT